MWGRPLKGPLILTCICAFLNNKPVCSGVHESAHNYFISRLEDLFLKGLVDIRQLI